MGVKVWVAALALAASSASAAPIAGAYRVVTISDGKTTMNLVDMMKKAGRHGEAILEFGDDALALGVWGATSELQPSRPGQTLSSVCRAQVTTTLAWDGPRFSLPGKLAVKGWSGGYHVTKVHEDGATKTSRWAKELECSFTLTKGTYTVAIVKSDAKGPSVVTLTDATSVLTLDRAMPLAELDAPQIAKDIAPQ